MKTKYFLIVFFFNTLLFSQNTFQVKYKMLTLFDGTKNHHATLTFSNEKASFVYVLSEKDTATVEYQDADMVYHIDIPDKKQQSVYTNLKTKTTSELVYFKEDIEKYLVQDSLVSPVWDISTETKQIDNHLCQKATTFFKGRSYEAWFTTDYSTQHGPWKLNGLPGLILEAHDSKNEVFFEVSEIANLGDRQIEEPTEIPKISRLEYNIKFKKFQEDLINRFSAKGDRDTKITFKISKKYGLEIE